MDVLAAQMCGDNWCLGLQRKLQSSASELMSSVLRGMDSLKASPSALVLSPSDSCDREYNHLPYRACSATLLPPSGRRAGPAPPPAIFVFAKPYP